LRNNCNTGKSKLMTRSLDGRLWVDLIIIIIIITTTTTTTSMILVS
jgi:hypothetical protein